MRVGTVDIDENFPNTKMPEVACDDIESRKRKAYESVDSDQSDSLVMVQASESSPLIEVSRKRFWTVQYLRYIYSMYTNIILSFIQFSLSLSLLFHLITKILRIFSPSAHKI